MASSSSPNSLDDYEPVGEEDEEEEEEEEEEETEEHDLELGLGLGLSSFRSKPDRRSASVSASASSSSPFHSQRELGLGLGLGFDNEVVRNSSGSLLAPPCNYRGLLHHHHYNHHHQPSSFTLLTSPSWPWHMDSGAFLQGENLQMQVPESHHGYRRRPETGVWFNLRSSVNREGETLPQIPKAYIRVKDENVTVLMVKTYLVTKLGLTNEAEIDISCMGQKLLHTQTLKYVRDVIWRPRFDSLNATASMDTAHETLSHLMSLNYGKRSFWD